MNPRRSGEQERAPATTLPSQPRAPRPAYPWFQTPSTPLGPVATSHQLTQTFLPQPPSSATPLPGPLLAIADTCASASPWASAGTDTQSQGALLTAPESYGPSAWRGSIDPLAGLDT